MLTGILVCDLLKQNLTLIGTIMANRREVHRNSKQQKEKRLKALWHCMTILSKFYYCHMSHKRNRNVLMMSSLHSSISITNCHKKPTVITDYNKYKGRVDTLDENCKEFSCLKKTDRWPMIISITI